MKGVPVGGERWGGASARVRRKGEGREGDGGGDFKHLSFILSSVP